MPKASSSLFAACKQAALTALASAQEDGFAPDAVRFFNDDDGFIFRLTYGDVHNMRIVSWTTVEVSTTSAIARVISEARESLARTEREAQPKRDLGAGIALDWLGGNCPVQAEGYIDGKRFYFRARGEHWSLEIHPTADGQYLDWPDEGQWRHEETYGTWPEAGWMPEDMARAMIVRGAELYRANGARV